MNRLAVSWVDVALRLEDELFTAHVLKEEFAKQNSELRALLANLVFAISRNVDLLAYARCELEALGPEREAA
jgi:hypothetical protein